MLRSEPDKNMWSAHGRRKLSRGRRDRAVPWEDWEDMEPCLEGDDGWVPEYLEMNADIGEALMFSMVAKRSPAGLAHSPFSRATVQRSATDSWTGISISFPIERCHVGVKRPVRLDDVFHGFVVTMPTVPWGATNSNTPNLAILSPPYLGTRWASPLQLPFWFV